MLFNFYLYILSNKHTFYDLNIDLTILEIVALPIKLKVYITKEPPPKEMTLSLKYLPISRQTDYNLILVEEYHPLFLIFFNPI